MIYFNYIHFAETLKRFFCRIIYFFKYAIQVPRIEWQSIKQNVTLRYFSCIFQIILQHTHRIMFEHTHILKVHLFKLNSYMKICLYKWNIINHENEFSSIYVFTRNAHVDLENLFIFFVRTEKGVFSMRTKRIWVTKKHS